MLLAVGLTRIKPNRCLSFNQCMILKVFSLNCCNILLNFCLFTIIAEVFLTLYQMNWPCVAITDVWAEQSTIQRVFHVLYSFDADKLIGSSSAFKAHFQRRKIVHLCLCGSLAQAVLYDCIT